MRGQLVPHIIWISRVNAARFYSLKFFAFVALGLSFCFLSLNAQAACGAYPVGDNKDKVLSFVPDGSGRLVSVAAENAPTSSLGMLVYDSSVQALKVCDGDDWVSLSMSGSGDPLTYARVWGSNENSKLGNADIISQTDVPVGLNTLDWASVEWDEVSTGASHGCGVRSSDKRIFCWGLGTSGRLGGGDTSTRYHPTVLSTGGNWHLTAWKTVTTGDDFTCGIRASDDRIFCWGRGGRLGDGGSSNIEYPVPLDSSGGFDTTAWKSVSAGSAHACAIRASDDRMFCWGLGGSGRLGTGGTGNEASPVPLTSTDSWDAVAWKSVSAGSAHTCAIRASDDQIFCWGLGSYGRLGTGDTTSTNSIPRALTSTDGWDAVAWKSVNSGGEHTCAIRASDDQIFCWGRGSNGRMGTGDTTSTNSIPRALTSTDGWDAVAWKQVSAGSEHTCAVRVSDDHLFCWGAGGSGRLGTGSTGQQTAPAALDATGDWDTASWSSVSAGDDFTCAIRLDQKMFCWGNGSVGRLASGGTTNQNSPAPISESGVWNQSPWKQVSAGSHHACAIRVSDDRIFCWGEGSNGVLGNGATIEQISPSPLTSTDGWDAVDWKSVATGNTFSCGVRASDDRLFCWGSGASGKLGTGDTTSTNSIPRALTSTDGWDAVAWNSVALGVNHTCGIRVSDNRLFCWGSGGSGRLGNGGTSTLSVPTALDSTGGWDAMEWKSVGTGFDHTCAIRNDDKIFCWGNGANGRLGNGSTTNQTSPGPLTSTDGWEDVEWKFLSVGRTHNCAIRASDDQIFCWGSGSDGELGTGDTTTTNSTPRPLTSTDGWDTVAWKSVSAGDSSTCAIRASDNRIFCWGKGANGQLGNGGTGDASIPTPLTSTDDWDTASWDSVSVGGNFVLAIESDPTLCSTSFPSTDIGSQDLVMEMRVDGGSILRSATKGKFAAPKPGMLAYNKTDKKMVMCNGTSWRPLETSAAGSCASYPAGDTDGLVIEWLADGNGLTYISNRTLRSTPREGSLIFNSSLKRLQFCDGTNWQTIDVGS